MTLALNGPSVDGGQPPGISDAEMDALLTEYVGPRSDYADIAEARPATPAPPPIVSRLVDLQHQISRAIGEINAGLDEAAAVTIYLPTLTDLPLYAPSIEPRTKTTGRRSVLDLPTAAPPKPLLDGWLHPVGTTILYGKGGVGKGITASWLTLELTKIGHKILVVDFESHPNEYGSRMHGLGLSEAQRDKIHYVDPYGDSWTERRGSLYEIADILRSEADDFGATYVLIDSYTPAASSDDAMGGQKGAEEMRSGIVKIARPALLLAHVAGGGPRHPDKPFGSVHIHNLVARWTWSVESDGDNQSDDAYGSSITKLEYRHHKRNDGAQYPDKKMSFEFHPNGDIEAIVDDTRRRGLADMIEDILSKGDRRNTKQISSAIRESFDQEVDERTIRKTMRRHPTKFSVDESCTPQIWTLNAR